MKNESIKELNEINIKTKVEVEIGYPPEKILRKIKEDKCELVVIGTIGLKGISKVSVIGSMARKILEKALCNVLLVH